MTSSLVGSEMCIRDRHPVAHFQAGLPRQSHLPALSPASAAPPGLVLKACLLYTSDAADDM
eukprot:3043689-Prorocentrum_lima.AAC.1